MMLSSLPSLAPRDSYALWYTPTHHATDAAAHQDPAGQAADQIASPTGSAQNNGPLSQRRTQHNAVYRSPLARLRADEVYIERRKQNVQNYGSSWIRPPGIAKSLHQLREERREMKEHQEALRREQLAQELAEAEAEVADELLPGVGGEGEMDEARDLDDDIPEAETSGINAGDSENEDREVDDATAPRGILGQRRPDEAYQDALIRGEGAINRHFVVDGPDSDDEDQSQILQEEDLIHEFARAGGHDIDMAMDADLDNDVPDAEIGEYEHTDTEEELSTSDEGNSINIGRFMHDRTSLTTSLVRSDGTQNSLDLSNLGDNTIARSPARLRNGGNNGRTRRGHNF